MEELVDASLDEVVVCAEFLCSAGIVAVVTVDYFQSFFLYAVHVGF